MSSDGPRTTDRFCFFWGGWPSQWFKSPFTVAGVHYNCCEQFMMAEKARVFRDTQAVREILAEPNPRRQKALGRGVRGFDPDLWNSVSRGIVYTGNLAKFSRGELRALLLATGERTIVEASPTDTIWGIGMHQDDPRAEEPAQWRGSNWLGIALMQVRNAIQERPALDATLQAQLEARRKLDA